MSRFLTIVYEVPDHYDVAGFRDHQHFKASSWSHAIDERDQWKARTETLLASEGAVRDAEQKHKGVIEALRMSALINPFGSVENAKARDAAKAALQTVAPSPYNHARIAWELERTALGDGYYGNALYVAKDLPGIALADVALLDRYMTGIQTQVDHVALQDLALRIDRLRRTLDPSPPESETTCPPKP